jgi:tetratricopeptide (TPR) repeat protein
MATALEPHCPTDEMTQSGEWRPPLARRMGWVVLAVALAYAIPVWSEWAERLLSLFRSHNFSPQAWRYCFQASEPLASVWMSWPVLVALALVVSGWTELLFAAIASLVLLVGDDVFRALFPFFSTDNRIGGRLSPAGARLTAFSWHVIRALFTIFVVSRAARLMLQARAAMRGQKLSESRPAAITGRLMVVGTLVFGVFVVGAQGWTVFEEVGLRNPGLIRALADAPNSKAGRFRETPQQRRGRRLETDLALAGDLMLQENTIEARKALVKTISGFESLAESVGDPNFFARSRAEALNNLAWLLATCPEESLRDSVQAVKFARRSLELEGRSGNTWNTLAVALYRDSNFAQSLEAFERSMALRDGGDAFDWFFLAMLDARRGRPAEARRWYDKATSFRETSLPTNRELHRFHVEAAKVLGLDPPPPLVTRPAPAGRARARRLGGRFLYLGT